MTTDPLTHSLTPPSTLTGRVHVRAGEFFPLTRHHHALPRRHFREHSARVLARFGDDDDA